MNVIVMMKFVFVSEKNGLEVVNVGVVVVRVKRVVSLCMFFSFLFVL